jgi:hypothetical protein
MLLLVVLLLQVLLVSLLELLQVVFRLEERLRQR